MIQNLKDETRYDIYLTGTNKIGESAPSMHYSGTTESLYAPITPNYKLINVAGENGGTETITAEMPTVSLRLWTTIWCLRGCATTGMRAAFTRENQNHQR